MPPVSRPAPKPSAGELAAEQSKKDAELAVAADKDPNAPGKQPENLVVVETKYVPVEAYSHPLLRLSAERVRKMGRVEILALGYDRAYWKRGVSHKTHAELVELFLSAQERDQTLHDEPEAGK